MNLFTWGENLVRKFNIWDIAFLKLYLFSLGAIAGAYFSQFVLEYIWYFVVIVVISLIWLLYRMFR